MLIFRSLKSFLQFNVLWISSILPFFRRGPLSKTAGHKWPQIYKEYIQGCISVLFSYKIGNVFPKPAGQVFGHVVLLFFSSATTSINYHSISSLSTTFLNLFKKFFQFRVSTWFLGTKKWNESVGYLLIGSFHFFERRKRDLNPRAGFPTYTLSRGASSASWVFLQVCLNYNLRSKCLQCYVILWLREGFSRKRINYYICRSLFCQHEFFFFSAEFSLPEVKS